MMEFGDIRKKHGKGFFAWAVQGDLDTESAVSNTFEMEWPPVRTHTRSSRRSTALPDSTLAKPA
jgi:predicted NUDIX family NTP pyrophosphohydrolase